VPSRITHCLQDRLDSHVSVHFFTVHVTHHLTDALSEAHRDEPVTSYLISSATKDILTSSRLTRSFIPSYLVSPATKDTLTSSYLLPRITSDQRYIHKLLPPTSNHRQPKIHSQASPRIPPIPSYLVSPATKDTLTSSYLLLPTTGNQRYTRKLLSEFLLQLHQIW
jgi:hypothetical protein